MTKHLLRILCLFFFTLPVLAQTDVAQKSLSLSLEDCIVKAMKNNLGLQIEVLTPDLRDISVSQANEKFLPSLSFTFGRSINEQESYNFLDAAGQLNSNSNLYQFNLTQQVPGGGNLTFRMYSSKYDTNRSGITINPSYRAEMRFGFEQPLLRNFGFRTARHDIIIAQTNFQTSLKDLERAVQETVYNVEQSYWNLVSAIENLKVAQQSLKLAQDLLEKNQRGVEVGTLAPIEVINAEAEVARREADILSAEANVRNMEDTLKYIINLNADIPNSEFLQIAPTETPTFEEKAISLEEALTTAMQNRPDLASSRMGIKNYESNVGYAANQLLPDLSFSIDFWSPGVSGDQRILDPRDPFGEPLEIIPGGISDSFKSVFGFDYPNWNIGLTLNVPLNTIVSRAAYAQAKVNLEQAMLMLKNQEMQIYTDIKIAVRNVETTFKQIQAYQVARELAQKQLEAEEEKLRVGLSTNFLVLQYQRDLANARVQEITAIINYNLALAQLERDMGISLKEKNIQMPQGSRR